MWPCACCDTSPPKDDCTNEAAPITCPSRDRVWRPYHAGASRVELLDDDDAGRAIAAGVRASRAAIAAGAYGVGCRTRARDPEFNVFACTTAAAGKTTGPESIATTRTACPGVGGSSTTGLAVSFGSARTAEWIVSACTALKGIT